MRYGSSRIRRHVTLALMTLAALGLAADGLLAGGAHHASRTRFQATDDWLFDPSAPLDELLAKVECVDGAPTGNPLAPCPEGSRVRVRDLPSGSLVLSRDSRFSGAMTVVSNGDLDPSYAGPVWGSWDLGLATGDGRWQGVWYGKRRFHPDQSGTTPGTWVSTLHLVGYGTGSLDGHVATATATEYSFTALPVPYEALAFLGFPGVCPPGAACPPEGVLRGLIFAPPHH
jgi:hypothetical protein